MNYAAKAYSAAGAVPLTGSREAFIECSAEPGFTAESLQNEVDNAGIYCRYNGVLGCDFSSMVKYLDDPEETRKVFDIMKSLSRHTFLIVFTAEQAIGREEKMVSALCKAFPSVVRLAPYSYIADDLALIMASELTKYQVEIPMQQLRGIADNLPKKKVQYKNTLTSSSTVLTKHTAEDVKPTFNDTSSLIDRVKVVPLPGGESYKRGFEKGNGTGGYSAEGADYTSAEPTFGYAEMNKTKVTAYCEEPEEIVKLSPSDYDRVIGGSSERAVRKFISREILVGTGASGHLTGIFHVPSSAANDIIDRNTDIAVAEIDEDTLDEIIYGFGGDEEVEDVAVLILNKADLKAFATCRKTNGDKAYTVVNRGNTGTIDGVPYIINSACKAISASTTSTGDYAMAYGPLSNYELPVFSDMDVQHSTEFKFKQGQIAHRADIFVGGNVAAWNGFLRVKKAAKSS